MSVQTLYTAATGMEALQTKLDVIANNLANVNTTAFKRDRANFEDLFYRDETLAAESSDGTITAVGTSVGLGTQVSSVQRDFRQGAFRETGGAMDWAIGGGGFFEVEDANGGRLYTRAGNFSINRDGAIVLGSASRGYLLAGAITIPQDGTNVEISADGTVLYRQAGTTGMQQAGNVQLAQFVNPEGLLKLGENLYQQTDASGTATPGVPGLNGLGVIRGGWLEASNVEPVAELIDLITTQRAFELNSQAVQAGDDILKLITNLAR